MQQYHQQPGPSPMIEDEDMTSNGVPPSRRTSGKGSKRKNARGSEPQQQKQMIAIPAVQARQVVQQKQMIHQQQHPTRAKQQFRQQNGQKQQTTSSSISSSGYNKQHHSYNHSLSRGESSANNNNNNLLQHQQLEGNPNKQEFILQQVQNDDIGDSDIFYQQQQDSNGLIEQSSAAYLNQIEDFQHQTSQNNSQQSAPYPQFLLKQESLVSVMSEMTSDQNNVSQQQQLLQQSNSKQQPRQGSTSDLSYSIESSPVQMNNQDGRRRQLPSAQQQQEKSAFNFFERQQSDRKKRTFEILSQFNPALASEVIYKDGAAGRMNSNGHISSFDSGHGGQVMMHMISQGYSLNDRSAIIIQCHWKGFSQRKKYERMLINQFTAQEEAREVEEKKRVERWMMQKETEQLEKKIEDKNRLFQANLNRRIQAAIVIQRAFRSFMRLKNKGISTTQLLTRKQIEEDYGEDEMPTVLMENLLDDRRQNLMKFNSKKGHNSKQEESWPPSLVDQDIEQLSCEDHHGVDENDIDGDDEDCFDHPKIPQKTEIFEGQVVQVEKLVKEEEQLLSQQKQQQQQQSSGRKRMMKAQIRRDKQRINFEKQMMAGFESNPPTSAAVSVKPLDSNRSFHGQPKKRLAISRQNSSRSYLNTPGMSSRQPSTTEASPAAGTAKKADKKQAKSSSRQQYQIFLPSQQKQSQQLSVQGQSARSSKHQSRGHTPVFNNHYIDLEPGSEYMLNEEEYSNVDHLDQHDLQQQLEDEISRNFVLVAKKKGISINKSRKSQRNNYKIWARRKSHQFELEQDQVQSSEKVMGGLGGNKRPQRSKGLSLLGIDANDFPPPIMQQSKTPNNIKSVIRQVNFVRAPRDQIQAKGGKVVQKVTVSKTTGKSEVTIPSQQPPTNSNNNNNSSRPKKHSIDFQQQHHQQLQIQDKYSGVTAIAVAQFKDYMSVPQSAREPMFSLDEKGHEIKKEKSQFNKVKKLSKHDIQDIVGVASCDEPPQIQYPQVDNLFQRRQQVAVQQVTKDDTLQDLLVDEGLGADNLQEGQIKVPKSFLLPSSKELLIDQQIKIGGELSNGLSNGSGSGEPFQGYAVQRMPVGLAKELVSSSTGSGNSGGLGALVNSLGINSASLESKGSGGPLNQKSNEGGGTSQLDMSLNNLFDSLKMKNGPLIHQNRFDLTQKLNEEILQNKIWAGVANSSGGHTDNSENVPPPEGSVEFADLVQQTRNYGLNINSGQGIVKQTEVQEPRILDSTNVAASALINVEGLFDQQRDRFDYYDAAAAVTAAQKLKNKLKNDDEKIFLNFRGATIGTYDESVGSSSDETAIRRPIDELQQQQLQQQQHSSVTIPPQQYYQNQYQNQQPKAKLNGGPSSTSATRFITTSDEYCLQQVVESTRVQQQFQQQDQANAEQMAEELDNRYQYFRELLKNFSEREESLKEKLMNRDHLLSSFYNQDALLLESGVSISQQQNLIQQSQQQSMRNQNLVSPPILSVQQNNKAIPTRNIPSSNGGQHKHQSSQLKQKQSKAASASLKQQQQSIMIGGGPSSSKQQPPFVSQTASSLLANVAGTKKTSNLSGAAGKKDGAAPGHRSTLSNPYQNQQIQKPWMMSHHHNQQPNRSSSASKHQQAYNQQQRKGAQQQPSSALEAASAFSSINHNSNNIGKVQQKQQPLQQPQQNSAAKRPSAQQQFCY